MDIKMRNEILGLLNSMNEDADFESSENFIEDNLIDSFEIVNLVFKIEKFFSIEISGRDIIPENFVNINSITNLITKYLEGKK